MIMTYDETKDLIEIVLSAKSSEARHLLRQILNRMKRSEPEFYVGIIEHGPAMNLTSEQWFDLLSKLTTQVLRDASAVMNRLSKTQKEKLPPATLG